MASSINRANPMQVRPPGCELTIRITRHDRPEHPTPKRAVFSVEQSSIAIKNSKQSQDAEWVIFPRFSERLVQLSLDMFLFCSKIDLCNTRCRPCRRHGSLKSIYCWWSTMVLRLRGYAHPH
jgi:hypothetical protein